MMMTSVMFAHLSLQCQLLLQVFNLGFVPDNLGLELLLNLWDEMKQATR